MVQVPAMCTIIAKNYLAVARTLCQSFLAQHADGKCYVLIIDDFQGLIDASQEVFEMVTPAELEIPNHLSFCFKYDIVELSTAFKPYLMTYLLRQKNLASLVYLDPDIQVFNSLQDIFEGLNQHDIILTPHLDKDYPDRLRPDTSNIIKHGVYNLGFIGVSARDNGFMFLEWWQAKLYNDCVISPDGSQYVDQKIINIVPTIFENVKIEQGVGYNLAYWNIHSRHIRRDAGIWKCNEDLLYFYHFSSYDPNTPDLITKPEHMNRYVMSDRPDLLELFTEYRAQIMQNGYETSRKWVYSLGCFDSGKPISKELRVYYRDHPENWELWGNPFTSSPLKKVITPGMLAARWGRVKSQVAFRSRLKRSVTVLWPTSN
jgi:lipopolysaccharide biosynthesis glycosyltransferase